MTVSAPNPAAGGGASVYRSAGWPRDLSPGSRPGPPAPASADAGADRARYLAHAAAAAARLRAHAVETPRGGITWPAPPGPEPDRPPANLGPHLYHGVLGVALFLAAVDRVLGRDDHRETVLRAVGPLRRGLRELVRDPGRAGRLHLQVGGFAGLGSYVYGFVRLGQWLAEPALIGEAHDLTLLLTRERIGADARLDVVDGSAGAALALLALHDVAPEANAAGLTPLETASRCAAHLVERRHAHDGRPRAWSAPDRPPLSGFAHGAAGIGYALLRVFARTGNQALRDAALEGFAFEHSLFDAGADNWLDLRTGRLLEQRAWCHGTPGMALGRLGALEAGHAGPAARDALAALLRGTRAMDDAPLDHLCCGNLGRADILLEAHQVLGEPGLLDDARALAARTVRRAEAAGDFALVRDGEAPGLRPGLFHGLSGVGFALLRLASPGTLPCILRLE